jgi:eukaryotic-like serine/threonine-protein kinase
VADLREQIQIGLADRYRLERELGRGGMATVFLAHDLRHDRPVALKVLHPELAATLGPERFQREIRTTARLQHPHILPVLDSGDAAGQLWYTMPYVDGESLGDRLRRERQLPLDDALQITREVADALGYAHSQGIVHRDIKPGNILLSRGHALVADFGIARALQVADAEPLTATGMAVGTPAYMSPEQADGASSVDGRSDVYSLGCVLYEMLAGELPFTGSTPMALIAKRLSDPVPSVRRLRAGVPVSVDEAVSKALAREPVDRFQSAANLARALADPAVSSGAGSPPAAAFLAGTAAAGAPAKPTSRARVSGVATLGLGVLLGLGFLFAWLRTRPAAEPTALKRVAVLPFENLGRPEDEYFADGMTDEVRGRLAALPSLEVIASASSGQYKHSPKPPEQIARELGVEYLLVGKVRWEKQAGGASQVRVSPELVRVGAGGAPTTRWQEPFDAPLTDVFRVQADIAGRVAEALGVALGAGERGRLAERPTENLDAYDAYLRGEEASGGLATLELAALQRAVSHYERAVALDSAFALAWAQLSRADSKVYWNTLTPASARAARRAAERALALAPQRPEGYLALGDYYYYVRADPPQALAQYARGQRLAPKDARLLTAAAVSEMWGLGRVEEALSHLRQAEVLDPRSVLTTQFVVYALVCLRRYPEALAAADRGLAFAPGDLGMIHAKVTAHLARGDLAGARAALRAVPQEVDPAALVAYMATYNDLYWALDDQQQRLLLRLSPEPFGGSRGAWALALAETHALRGDTAEARAYADSARLSLEEQLKGTPEDAQTHALLGVALAYRGRKAEAIRAVALAPLSKDTFTGGYVQHQLVRIYLLAGEPERALDQLEPLLKISYWLSPGWLKIDPNFAPLRGNPRFERLVNGP